MSLLLVRHGRSALESTWRALDREEVMRWRADYDDAGIGTDDRPPARLVADVTRARLVAASDLPRAHASARVRSAVAWCAAEAYGHDAIDAPVVIVTHGVFRRLLATALVAARWRAEGAWRSYAHWSAWRLVAPPNESPRA